MGTTGKIFKSASIVAIITLLSKFLGFFREVLIASKFGSGYETDTYVVAITATFIIVSMLAAAFNTVLVPIFSEIDGTLGKKASIRFLNNSLNIMFIMSIFIMGLAWLASPIVISILGSGFEGEQFQLAVKMNRIGLPIIMGMFLTYVFCGFLQSRERFTAPSATGIPFNIVQIIFLITLSSRFGIEGLMVAVAISVFGQVLIQIPSAKKEGFNYQFVFDLKDKYIKKMFMLVIPVMLGTAISQINIIVDRTLASNLIEGSISALNYANRLSEMIFGIFIVTITTVIFPMLSRAATENNTKSLISITKKGSLMVFLITIPSTLGLMILAEPIVKVLFERGAFDATATDMTYRALFFYAIGLIGMGMRLMLTRVYYSIQDTRTPTINGAIAMVLNIVLNLILIGPMGHTGLALATSISSIFTTLLLLTSLSKKVEGFELRPYGVEFLKITIASLVMGVFVYLPYRYLKEMILGDRMLVTLALLAGIVLLGVIIYINICYALGVGRKGRKKIKKPQKK